MKLLLPWIVGWLVGLGLARYGPPLIAEPQVEVLRSAMPAQALVQQLKRQVRSWSFHIPLDEDGAELPSADPEQVDELGESIRVRTRSGKVVFIPADCMTSRDTYDIVLHFHGAWTAMQPAFDRSGLQAVLVTTVDGIGGGAYARKYAGPRVLDRLLDGVGRVVREQCSLPRRKLGRVALSAWSAGYGAIASILKQPGGMKRVDAVLLADGLHAALAGTSRRSPTSVHMQPFVQFARQALKGHKLMGLTHSAIPTRGYASTTETSNYLLDELEMRRYRDWEAGPRDSMLRTSLAGRGALWIQGFAGTNKQAHSDHLFAIGDTLLPLLREYWRR